MSPPNYSPSPLYFPILPLLPLLLLTTFIYQTSASFPIALRQTSTEYTDDRAFKNAVLNTSNYYRAQHNASALSWNESLADFAQEWGNGCVFMHSGGPNGENLASGFPNASASIAAWDNESSLYNFASPKFSHETGHFTQLVWKATTTIGCSHTFCNSRPVSGEGQSAPGWYVVCEYYPPGNVEGEFGENVQAAVKGKGGGCPQGAVCGGAGRLFGEGMMLEKVWSWPGALIAGVVLLGIL